MCTLEKRGSVFVLTLTGANEHRLNPTLMDAILAALSRVRSESAGVRGSALVITAEGKFFSNGLDLPWAGAAGAAGTASFTERMRLIGSKFRALTFEVLSLPMPTIAAVSGHASAGGFILALCHDYILMRKDRGVLYLSELDISFPIPQPYMTIIRCKVAAHAARRDAVLRAVKLTAEEAVAKGIIDYAHGTAEETVEGAVRLGEELAGRKWDGHTYALMRKTLLSEVMDAYAASEDSKSTENDINRLASRLFRPKILAGMDIRLSQADTVDPDDLDEEFDTMPSTKPSDIIRVRYDRLRTLTFCGQNVRNSKIIKRDHGNAPSTSDKNKL